MKNNNNCKVVRFAYDLVQIRKLARLYKLNEGHLGHTWLDAHTIWPKSKMDGFSVVRMVADIDHIARGEQPKEFFGVYGNSFDDWNKEAISIIKKTLG